MTTPAPAPAPSTPAPTTPAPTTVVVAPRPGIGDMIWHVPLLRAIAATSAQGQITLMTRASVQARWLFKGEAMVAATQTLQGSAGAVNAITSFLDLRSRLSAGRFDRAVILHPGPRFSVAAKLAGIKTRIGYAKPGKWHALTHPVDIKSGLDILGAFDEMRAFAWRSGFVPASRVPDLTPDPQAMTVIGERFGTLPRPWIVIGIGATSNDRLWPMERFGHLARAMADMGAGTLFALGGPNEGAQAQALVGASNGAPVTPATDLRLDQTIALLAAADAFVGVDSGPMNLAAALGRPAFTIFGSILNRMPLDLHPTTWPILPKDGLAADGVERVTVADVLDVVGPFLLGGVSPRFPAHGIRPPEQPTDYGLTDRVAPDPSGTWRRA